jgi:hypothetical protein
MASVSNPTFGCGNFLPGFGPFSIPKYDGPYNPVGVPGGGGGVDPGGGPQEEDVEYGYCKKGNAPGVKGECGTILWPAPPAPPPGFGDIPGGADKLYPLGILCIDKDLGSAASPATAEDCYIPELVPRPTQCRCCIVSETYSFYTQGNKQFYLINKNRECRDKKLPCNPGGGIEHSITRNLERIAKAGFSNISYSPQNATDNEECPNNPNNSDKCCGEETPNELCCPNIRMLGSKTIDGGDPTIPGGPISPRTGGAQTGGTGGGGGIIPLESEGPGGGNELKSLPSSRYGSGLRERKAPEIPPKNILEGKLPYYMPSQTAQIKDPNAGPFDPDIDILTPQSTQGNAVVRNSLPIRNNIFNRNIGAGIDYTIRNSNLYKNWNSGYGYKVTPETVIKSIDPKLLNAFRQMKKIDGSRFTRADVYTIFKNRILDGTINSFENTDLRLNPNEFFKIAKNTKDLQIPDIKKSTSPTQNQGAALGWLELNSIPADVNAAPAKHINKIMNWQFLPTDINMYIPIVVGGETKKLFVKDDRTFSPYPTLTVQDGDYIVVGNKRLFCTTERDHAILPSEGARQTAIKLLGGTGQTNLTVSSLYSARIEYSNNLNLSGESPREQMIFAKLVGSSIVTEDTPQSLLHKTKATYQVVDTTTAQGLRDFNDYIKYKFFHRTFTMAWDDLFLDHLEFVGEFEVESEDIIFNAPKTNKNIPLLTRHVPYYIGILTTNRQTYLPFNQKSVVTQFDKDTNIVERKLSTVPTIDPTLWKETPFIENKLGWPVGNTVDVFGKTNIQNIISEYNPSATVYKEAYKVDGKLTTGTNVRRNKKFLRTLYDIVINNLDKNYVLERQGTGRGVYWFDIFSRLTLTEFNRFTFLSNASTLIPTIAKGLYDDIKIFSPLKYAGEVANNKTCLLRLKEGASADTYPQIKRTNITQNRFVYSTTGVSETRAAITNTERTEAKAGRRASTLS